MIKNFRAVFLVSLLLGVVIGIGMFMFQTHEQQKASNEAANYNESANYIVNKMGDCQKAKRRSDCLSQAAKDFLSKFSLKEIFAIFEKEEKRPELIAICHQEAHFLSREEYQKRKSIRDVFASCNHSCLGGCYHGAVEGYFIEKNLSLGGDNSQAVAEEIPKICGTQKDYRTPQDLIECLHGLGHAVMFLTENDLLSSLKLCDALHTKSQQDLCYTGAFMANVDSAGSQEHPSKYFKPDDLMYPCTILEKKYLDMCYTYAVLQPHQEDLKLTIEICHMVPSEYRQACFRTMGRDRVYKTTVEEKMKQECDLIIEHEFRDACYLGLVGSLIVRYGVDSSSPLRFCSLLDPEYKDGCYRDYGFRLKHWISDQEKLLKRCLNVPKEYVTVCQNGARIQNWL